jgi:hypothetical protein
MTRGQEADRRVDNQLDPVVHVKLNHGGQEWLIELMLTQLATVRAQNPISHLIDLAFASAGLQNGCRMRRVVVKALDVTPFLSRFPQAEVSAYPSFPGVEAHFLRAQLARIAGTTVVCPAGFFTAGEEEGALERNEEYAPAASAAELTGLEAWAHRNPHVKKQVRT